MKHKGPTPKEIKEQDRVFKKEQRARGRKVDRDGRIITRADVPMRDFWQHIDMESMRTALAESGDDRAHNLASLLMNPRLRTSSIARLCRECGITLQQLNDLWRKHNLALGMIHMASKLPKVMSDVAQDAESTYEVCPRCDGTATITRSVRRPGKDDSPDSWADVDEQCPRCKGAREVRTVGNKDARTILFDAVGLTGKSAPLFAQQINIGVDDTLEGTVSFSQKLIQSATKLEDKK